jgi:ribonuclease BN (tRNA processing enzyme)
MSDAIKYGPSRIEQCYTHKMSNPSKWTIQGHSKAGERTCFKIEPLNICLDAGINTYKAVRNIFISHTHSDHSYEWVHMFGKIQNIHYLDKSKDINRYLYFPESGYKSLMELFYAFQRLSGGPKKDMDFDESFIRGRYIIPVMIKPGDIITNTHLKNIKIEVLPAYHSADSVGYGFISIKTKLKPEFLEMSKSKDKELKKQFLELKKTTQITYQMEQPEVVFYSDSTIENLRDHTEWHKYPVVICECTSFDEVHTPEKTIEMSHTHWQQLFPIMQKHKDKEWIIIHTSMGMNNNQIDKYQKIMDSEGINGYIWKTKLIIDSKTFPVEDN